MDQIEDGLLLQKSLLMDNNISTVILGTNCQLKKTVEVDLLELIGKELPLEMKV